MEKENRPTVIFTWTAIQDTHSTLSFPKIVSRWIWIICTVHYDFRPFCMVCSAYICKLCLRKKIYLLLIIFNALYNYSLFSSLKQFFNSNMQCYVTQRFNLTSLLELQCSSDCRTLKVKLDQMNINLLNVNIIIWNIVV